LAGRLAVELVRSFSYLDLQQPTNPLNGPVVPPSAHTSDARFSIFRSIPQHLLKCDSVQIAAGVNKGEQPGGALLPAHLIARGIGKQVVFPKREYLSPPGEEGACGSPHASLRGCYYTGGEQSQQHDLRGMGKHGRPSLAASEGSGERPASGELARS